MLSVELPDSALDNVTALYKAGKGKMLRILVEVREPDRFGGMVPKEQTKWIKDQDQEETV